MRPGISSHRCPRCGIRKPLCFCAWIPRITLQTRVMVLMHSSEVFLTTNTARLLHLSLTNSDLQVHGRIGDWIDADTLRPPGMTSLLLYPSLEARELSPEFVASLNQPVTLVVPDANWRQTQRFIRREPALAGIQHVKLPAGPASEYHLKVQPHPSGLCTLEAVARSIGILESPDAQHQLEILLRVMVERTLWSRGKITAAQCRLAGIPADAFGH